MDHPDLPNPPGIAVRWVRSSAGLRAFTAVVGLVIAAIGVALATDRSAQLLCGDRACEVRAAAVLFPTEIRAIDPARPPAVVVRDARHGRNGALAGKSLNLRWTNDEVTLARGDTQSVEAQAVAVRARLAANQGTLVVGSEPSLFFAILGLYCGVLGLAMVIDGLGFGIRRHVSFDPSSRLLSTHLSLFGLAVRRRAVLVPPGSRLVAVPISATRPGHGRLAIELPGQPAQSLGMLDVPMYRQAVEQVLRSA